MIASSNFFALYASLPFSLCASAAAFLALVAFSSSVSSTSGSGSGAGAGALREGGGVGAAEHERISANLEEPSGAQAYRVRTVRRACGE